jgi:threonine/homoserine/homoserine lactone efflux protein
MVINNLQPGLLPLATFVFVMSITPGPNNIMLLTSGARFGLRPSVSHMLGITSGFVVLLALASAGIGALVLSLPSVLTLLTIGCVIYLLWLAWQLFSSAPLAGADSNAAVGKPWRWREAALFQLANPKAWAMAVSSASMASSLVGPAMNRYLILIAIATVINLPCILVWTAFGAWIRRWLGHSWVSRVFNSVMAGLIVATAVWMLLPLFRVG